MKTLIIITMCLCSSFALFGQIPQAFNYQAAVRNSAGEIQFETDANFRIEILQDGTSIYSENHPDKNTGKTGVVNFKVGLGIDVIGDFFSIDWGQGDLEIRVHLQLDSGQEEEMGTADIVAVPFALYAQNSGNDHWIKTDTSLYYLNTKVGIGTPSPAESLEVVGGMRLTGGGHYKLDVYATEDGDDNIIRSFDNNGSGIWTINMGDRDEGDNFYIDRPSNGNYDFTIKTNGNVGIGHNDPNDPLDVKGIIRVTGDNSHQKLRMYSSSSTLDNRITSYDENADLMWQVMMGRRSNSDRFEIDRPGNGVSDFYIDTDAITHVRVLQIHGGSDINEDFDSSVELKPGDVVIIDQDNEGQLCHTATEYDRKLAGVISGANGVNPGLSLSQEDVLEGEYPLAMLGRVYVKVEGSVSAGEMLTTSTKPGFAMAVKDYDRSRGAVIGKAMTSNEKGEGMVLVLIQPQ